MPVIKDIVQNLMADLATPNRRAGVENPDLWLKKVLTKRELAHIKFNYFKKGVLGLWVDSSSWLYSLNLKKPELIDKLQSISGTIKDMRFRIGETK